MPEPGIVLNSDQIGDLHELLDHAETIAQWLLHATDEIIDDLAQTAYAAHFHPRSAVFWLVEDLVHTQYRLHRALHPDTGSHDQDPGQDTHAEPAAQAATSATTSYRGRLDASASIGNQFHGLPEDARDALVERAATLLRSHGTRSCCLPVAGFEDEVHRRLGRPANRLYPAF